MMDNLNFYTVDMKYVNHLQQVEMKARGFSRVPNVDYGKDRKQKFFTGIVLQINDTDYYVPVTSFKEKKPDNFVIIAKNGNAVSSLRFNYMFPVPAGLATVISIDAQPDPKYKSLLSQELRYCIKNQDEIRRLAERTYKRVILGKDKGLVHNSCSFVLLEQACRDYHAADR